MQFPSSESSAGKFNFDLCLEKTFLLPKHQKDEQFSEPKVGEISEFWSVSFPMVKNNAAFQGGAIFWC